MGELPEAVAILEATEMDQPLTGNEDAGHRPGRGAGQTVVAGTQICQIKH